MEELSVISTIYAVYKRLIELNTTFDKKYRYVLGEQAVLSCSSLLHELILAKHAPRPIKKSYLIKAEAQSELLALQLRAVLELHITSDTNVLKIQAQLSEGRRMIGGWVKSLD